MGLHHQVLLYLTGRIDGEDESDTSLTSELSRRVEIPLEKEHPGKNDVREAEAEIPSKLFQLLQTRDSEESSDDEKGRRRFRFKKYKYYLPCEVYVVYPHTVPCLKYDMRDGEGGAGAGATKDHDVGEKTTENEEDDFKPPPKRQGHRKRGSFHRVTLAKDMGWSSPVRLH
ncbi:unnamed protein product [Cyprideis torosa]|uniref:Uncharacterized protein n=1 Tax=Cyprideis torosa TaxID=163714 RepID=A0A7R8WNR5_9CRUS|nr:unnamed protein product [Cyprideis torosa]CAG0906549.1 unnamed protein product [Cyprideis torosa]